MPRCDKSLSLFHIGEKVHSETPVKHRLLLSTALFASGPLLVYGIVAYALHAWRPPPLDPRLASASPYLTEVLKNSRQAFLSPDLLKDLPPEGGVHAPERDVADAGSRDVPTFLQLNRSLRFSAVCLGTNPSVHPLVMSLLASPLWVLSDVTPWGYLFKPPGSRPWSIPSLKELEDQWPDRSARSLWMIRTASNLVSIKRDQEALTLLDMADKTGKEASLNCSTRASLAAMRGRWEESLGLARTSLSLDGSNKAARLILIRSLIECGRANEALTLARIQCRKTPGDGESLYLLARSANAAGSSREEIDALSQLVRIARERNEPLGASLAYLGQAYARTGQRGPAIKAFQESLQQKETSEAEGVILKQMIEHISPETQRDRDGKKDQQQVQPSM